MDATAGRLKHRSECDVEQRIMFIFFYYFLLSFRFLLTITPSHSSCDKGFLFLSHHNLLPLFRPIFSCTSFHSISLPSLVPPYTSSPLLLLLSSNLRTDYRGQLSPMEPERTHCRGSNNKYNPYKQAQHNKTMRPSVPTTLALSLRYAGLDYLAGSVLFTIHYFASQYQNSQLVTVVKPKVMTEPGMGTFDVENILYSQQVMKWQSKFL